MEKKGWKIGREGGDKMRKGKENKNKSKGVRRGKERL